MSKKYISLISSLFGLFIFLFLAFGSSEDENSGEENHVANSDYTTSSDKQEYNSNSEKELSIKKEIVSVEKQKQLVKSFIKKIESIEKPATQSNKNFLETLDYYQQGFATSSDVIQSAKSTKKQCDNAMFSLSDLEVPSNLPNEIESLLDDARNELKISWSIKGTTYNNIIRYFKDYDPKNIEYFNNDVSEAQDYTVSASAKILKVQNKLGIQHYSINPSSSNNKQSKGITSEQENNKSYGKQIDSEIEPVIEDTESQNSQNKKTKKELRKEKRKKRKEDKKKNGNN